MSTQNAFLSLSISPKRFHMLYRMKVDKLWKYAAVYPFIAQTAVQFPNLIKVPSMAGAEVHWWTV